MLCAVLRDECVTKGAIAELVPLQSCGLDSFFPRFGSTLGRRRSIRSSEVKTSKAVVVAALLLGLVPLSLVWGATAQASPPKPHKTSKVAPLRAPKTSPVQDARYLSDVAKSDPDLATYAQQQGNVALKAMLTDGSAFCAFLRRGGGIDEALVNVAAGAKSVESETHLPSGVATFNAMEAVALIDLCPAEQKLVPASVRSKLHRLRTALASASA
jgi:hypothetical protein